MIPLESEARINKKYMNLQNINTTCIVYLFLFLLSTSSKKKHHSILILIPIRKKEKKVSLYFISQITNLNPLFAIHKYI